MFHIIAYGIKIVFIVGLFFYVINFMTPAMTAATPTTAPAAMTYTSSAERVMHARYAALQKAMAGHGQARQNDRLLVQQY